jgi:hypothetical protein
VQSSARSLSDPRSGRVWWIVGSVSEPPSAAFLRSDKAPHKPFSVKNIGPFPFPSVLSTSFLCRLMFYPENCGRRLLRTVGKCLPISTPSHRVMQRSCSFVSGEVRNEGSKAISVAAVKAYGVFRCLRIAHCLDSRLTDGGKALPEKGLVRPEGLGKSKKCVQLVGPRTRDLPACSTVPQPFANGWTFCLR